MVKDKKIPGLYPAGLPVDVFSNLEEWALWVHIDNRLVDFALLAVTNPTPAEVEAGYADALSPEEEEEIREELDKLDYQIQYLMYQTRRFGVTFKQEPCEGKNVEPDESYQKWFDFWKNHFNSLGREGRRAFNDAVDARKGYSKFLPKTRWNGEPVEWIYVCK